ncbi:MAG: GIY-YIG nuclease family protein [Ktedonobacterales bacterium]
MMNRRKAMSQAYKERRLVGGVYRITSTHNGKYLLGHAADVASVRNRFEFSVTTGSAVDPRLRTDWEEFGASTFTLDVLEELEKPSEQSQSDFLEDLKTLEELWRAGLDAANEY